MPVKQNSELPDPHQAEVSLANKITGNLNPVDFARGLYTGAVEKPLDGLKQLAGVKITEKTESQQSDSSVANKAGVLVGQIVDFSILAAVSHRALKPIFKSSIDGAFGTSAKMFVAGAVDGGIFTASDNKNLLAGRTEAALISATTFAIMGGAGKALEGANLLKTNKFIAGSLNNALSGGVGGIASAYGTAMFHEGRLARADEVVSSAAQFAAFGAGMHALHAGIEKGSSNAAVKDAYYSAKWKVGESTIEAKRATYATLNELGMRHPVKRVGDLVFGSAKVEPVKVPITEENHPIALFEKELPLYVEKIQSS